MNYEWQWKYKCIAYVSIKSVPVSDIESVKKKKRIIAPLITDQLFILFFWLYPL